MACSQIVPLHSVALLIIIKPLFTDFSYIYITMMGLSVSRTGLVTWLMFGSLCFIFISFSASCLSSTLAELNISTSTCRLWLGFLERQEAKLEVADLEMLRFLLGVTRMDNEHSKGTAQARTVWTLRMRRDSGYIGQRMLSMEVPGQRKRGPQRKFMPAVKEDVQRVVGWRWGGG